MSGCSLRHVYILLFRRLSMVNIIEQVKETERTVINPVVNDTLTQLKELLNIAGVKTIRQYHHNQATRAKRVTSKDEELNISDDIMMVDVVDKSHVETFNHTEALHNVYPYVFKDSDVLVHARLSYIDTTLEFEINYKTTSRDKVNQISDLLLARTGRDMGTLMLKLNYYYQIPVGLLNLLFYVYKNKSRLVNQGHFIEYLNKHLTGRYSLYKNLSGNGTIIGINEIQRDVMGLLTFSDEERPEKIEVNETDRFYDLKFSLTLRFSRVFEMLADYPIMVYNKLLPEECYNWVTDGEYNKNLFYYDADSFRMKYFSQMGVPNQTLPCVRLPETDQFTLRGEYPYMRPLFIALCEITNKNDILFNLNELGVLNINKHIIDFISEVEREYITKEFQSLLHISIYENERLIDGRLIEIDNCLNVKLSMDLDLRRMYRVKFSVLRDLSKLDRQHLLRFVNHVDALKIILEDINQTLFEDPQFNRLKTIESYSVEDRESILRTLFELIIKLPLDDLKMYTVMATNIISIGHNNEYSKYTKPAKAFRA